VFSSSIASYEKNEQGLNVKHYFFFFEDVVQIYLNMYHHHHLFAQSIPSANIKQVS